MSDDWWSTPAGVQSALREEIKIRDARIEELEAKLAQQDDLLQAAVAAERDKAASIVAECIWGWGSHWKHPRFGSVNPQDLAAAIRKGGHTNG